jgi:hypothetical protein
MKKLFIVLFLSLLSLLIPSALLAGCISLYQEQNHFWLWFFTTFGILFVLGLLSNNFLNRKTNKEILQLQNNIANLTSQQAIEISCSYCKTENIIPILLNQRNTFICKKCHHDNLVIFQFMAAQISTPLTLPQLGAQVNNATTTPTT